MAIQTQEQIIQKVWISPANVYSQKFHPQTFRLGVQNTESTCLITVIKYAMFKHNRSEDKFFIKNKEKCSIVLVDFLL